MVDIKYENALFEVYEILKYISEESRNKIPKKLIEYIKENKTNNHNFVIDKSIPIEEQRLLPETEAFITIIYRDYLCQDERKNDLNEIIKQNDLQYEIELRKKYNPNNLFEKTKIISNTQNLPIKIERENIFEKIIKFIKYKVLKQDIK